MKTPKSRKRTPSRNPKPTIPHDPAERPATMVAPVKIDAARRAEVGATLLCYASDLQSIDDEIAALRSRRAQSQAEHDRLAQIYARWIEDRPVPVAYELRGTDLCAVRVDCDGQIPPGAPLVLAMRPATAEDRTEPLPFDRPAQAEKSSDTPTGSANPDSPSPEKPYAVGQASTGAPDPLATWTKNALRDHETRMPAGYNRGRLVATEGPDGGLRCELPPPTAPTVGDRLTHPVHGEATVYCIDEGAEPRFCLLPAGASDYIWESAAGLAWWRKVPEPGLFEQAARENRGLAEARDPVAELIEHVERQPGPEHEPPLAVKKNRPADDDFSDDPAAAEAARDAAADIARDQPTSLPEDEPDAAEGCVRVRRPRRSREGGKASPRAEEPEPALTRVCLIAGCYLAGVAQALEECAGCGKPTSPLPPPKAKEGGKASKRRHRPVPTKAEVVAFGQEFESAATRATASPDTAAGIRTLLVERLGARGAARAESEARKACEGVEPDERLIECADIGGVDQRLRKLLVRLLELEPAAKSGAPKARKGGRR